MNKNEFLIVLAESDRTEFGRVDFAAQSEFQKVFSAIWKLESEVNNGGFDQYIRNTDSDVIAFAPIALRHINAMDCAAIVERTIELIAPLPADQHGRYHILEMIGEQGQDSLAQLDKKFFAYPDNLTEMLFEFVRRHPEAFDIVPSE